MRDTAVSGPGGAGPLPLPLSGFLWNTVNILHRGGVVRWTSVVVVVVPVISFILQVGGARVPALIVMPVPLFTGVFLSIF